MPRVPRRRDGAGLAARDRHNTPLKIYQYLRSGRPIVATRLRTHTQVLDDDVAFLAEATPKGLADAMIAAFADPARAADVGRAGADARRTKYSDEAFIAKTKQAVGMLFADKRPGVAVTQP